MRSNKRKAKRRKRQNISCYEGILFQSIRFPFLFNFVPNWGDNVLVGSGRKLLGPTKITSFFRSQPKSWHVEIYNFMAHDVLYYC